MTVHAERLKLKGDGWESDYHSVDNLLRYLSRKTRSESSRVGYLGDLARFCISVNATPEQVVTWDKKDIEKAIQLFCDRLARSPNVANTSMAHLTAFFFSNGFRMGKRSNLELDSYHVPSRFRATKEYIPDEEEIKRMVTVSGVRLRDRAIILLLYTAGLRNATLRALRWKDLTLDGNGDKPLYVSIYPEMKEVDPDACKGSIPYYTFAAAITVEALRLYKAEVDRRYGPITPDQIVFMSNSNLITKEAKKSEPLSSRSLGKIVKQAAKDAGLPNWKDVHPHVFRKAYERAMRNTKLHIQDSEFLMGHILPGSQDAYYDKTKIEELRTKYSKIKFFHYISEEVKDELELARREIAKLKQESGDVQTLKADLINLRKEFETVINQLKQQS